MGKSTFADEQMVAIVRAADRDPNCEVAKRDRIAEPTINTSTTPHCLPCCGTCEREASKSPRMRLR